MNAIITPVSGRVFVKLEKFGSETKSGIKLVKQGAEWNQETVLAEVVNKHVDETELQIGQVVIIRGDAGRWVDPELVEDKDHTYRIIDKEEVIATLSQKEESAVDSNLGII